MIPKNISEVDFIVVGVVNINRIMALRMHVVTLSRWETLDTMLVGHCKSWRKTCTPVPVGWRRCDLFFLNWEWQCFGCWSFHYFLVEIVHISPVASSSMLFTHFWCLELIAVWGPFQRPPQRGVRTSAPSLRLGWLHVCELCLECNWHVLHLLLFIPSIILATLSHFFWKLKGVLLELS